MSRVELSQGERDLAHLKTGPKTTGGLALLTGVRSASIARACHELRKQGRIIRTDRNGPRGKATWALRP